MEETTLRPIRFTVRHLLVTVALLAAVLALGRYLLSWNLHPDTVAKVQIGMSMQEVKKLLRAPERSREGDEGFTWTYNAYRFTNHFYRIKFDSNRRVRDVQQVQVGF
jgi:hypothetical protein